MLLPALTLSRCCICNCMALGMTPAWAADACIWPPSPSCIWGVKPAWQRHHEKGTCQPSNPAPLAQQLALAGHGTGTEQANHTQIAVKHGRRH